MTHAHEHHSAVPSSSKLELHIGGMHCQACAKRVEDALSKVPGVTSAHVNGATDIATIHKHTSTDVLTLIQSVKAAGYTATPVDPHVHGHDHGESFLPLAITAMCAIPFAIQMIGMLFSLHNFIPPWVQWTLATVVQVIAGYEFYRSSYYALRNGAADMNVLIAMGTTAAWLLSTASWAFQLDVPLYFESSVFIFLFILFGRWLEARFTRKASQAIHDLLQLQPRVVHMEIDGKITDQNIENVVVGNVLQVLVGERIPVDGVVVAGDAEVDESMMSGESLPVRKIVGQKVFAGTLNINGVLKIEAREIGVDTLLSHIVAMVSQAQNSKAPAQKLADTISAWFVPAVALTAMMTFLFYWMMGMGGYVGLLNAITVLVIACPCALGLATPIVIVVAAGMGARMGILFKDAEVFDKARSLKTLFVDKTGTLTTGAMEVSLASPNSPVEASELVSVAASLEQQLKHPLAQAIVGYATKIGAQLLEVESFMSYPGRGIEGKLAGYECGVGSVAFAEEQGIVFDRLQLESSAVQGGTLILVWQEKKFMGYFVLTDRVRSHASEMVKGLEGMGIHVVMITGDREQAASEVAKEVGISERYAGLLPQEKLEVIKRAKSDGSIVGMVGDGINDAPALAAADVGIALEASTDVALESASIALLGGDLNGVVNAVKLSRETQRKIRQNLFLAFIYNVVAIPLAIFGFLTPAIAAAAMAMSSLSVVINALTLFRKKIALGSGVSS